MRRHIATVGLLLAFGVAGCSSGPEGGPLFNNEGGAEVTCMVHQTEEPGTRYTDRETRDMPVNRPAVFGMFKYYTANGAKPYCDGAPASDVDRAWAELYLELTGADPARVSTVLG